MYVSFELSLFERQRIVLLIWLWIHDGDVIYWYLVAETMRKLAHDRMLR